VTTPSGWATSPGPLSIFDIGITGTATAVVIGGSVQFTANITGCADPRVIWSVNRIVGGNAFVGTITAGGLYTAPAQAPPVPGIVTIRAESVGCPGLFAEQSLTIVAEPNAWGPRLARSRTP